MSYLRRKPEDEVRNIHSPLKKGSRESVTRPLLSQIPYLNGVFDDEETIHQLKPIYVRESDSEYIRRCKLGGSHDLLVYIDPATCKSKEPVAYPTPLWWHAMCEQSLLPINVDRNDNQQQQQQQEKKSSKSEHVSGAPERFVLSKHNRSSDKQQNAVSRQSQLSTNNKRK